MALTPKQITAASRGLWSGLSAFESYDAAQDAEAIGDYNALMEEEQTAEEVRRMRKDQVMVMGLAQARSAASGAQGETADAYMAALAKTGDEEADWLNKVGASKYDQALAEGQIAKNKALSSFWGDVSDLGQSIASLF